MSKPIPLYTTDLAHEYTELFDTCVIQPDKVKLVDSIIDKLLASKDKYQTIVDTVNKNMPWWFVGLIHYEECGLSFQKHLHNGDSLQHRTVRVPAGRPKAGFPPFSFETSAIDALTYKGFANLSDWSIPKVLYFLEGYNGYGYRQYHPNVKTPYLWSFTNHYTKGKYVKDGKYDPNAVSQQLGLAAIIKRLSDLHHIT